MNLTEVNLITNSEKAKSNAIIAREITGLIEGQRIIHTSSMFPIARVHMDRLVDTIKANPVLASMLKQVRHGHGTQSVEFINGGQIRYIARSYGGGRGLSADLVIIDNSNESCPESFMQGIYPTLCTSADPEVWFARVERG